MSLINNSYINIPRLLGSVIACTLMWPGSAPAAAHEHGNQKPSINDPVAIGGAFELTDQNGKTVRDGDLRGKVMLVFFGFTHCPDICPITVGTLSKLMELLGHNAKQVAPVFITVDPARDTEAVLKDYMSNFDKRLIALTGSPAQIKQAADAYKIYFSGSGASRKDGDYAVDHSTIIYMMGKDGKYVGHFSANEPVQSLLDAVNTYLKQNK